jgi:exopolysaccharide biosynthesis protein
MKKTYLAYLLLILLTCQAGFSQNTVNTNSINSKSEDFPEFIQTKTDSLFGSHQIISQLILDKSSFDRFYMDFSFCHSGLTTTSSLGIMNDAVAAINGSYFDRDKGGSVTYFEKNDSVLSFTKRRSDKWAKPDSLINGAVVITKDSAIQILPANPDQFYEQSKQEAAVLVAGPLLLYKSEKMKLPDMDFSNNRHPRTCLCQTKESLIFVTIDGRSKSAEGMNLKEVQEYLGKLNCLDAINLDGGGSTTMWIKDKGIVNYPSDPVERPVSNALVIKRKDNNH